MLRAEIRQQIGERLIDLYQRHRDLPLDDTVRYYTPGRWFHGPDPDAHEQRDFGIAAASLDGQVYCAGVCDMPFPMASISKVFAYALALEDHGRDAVLRRVGVEPSGDSFSSIVFDERARRPYNPMVNTGALAIVDLIRGRDVAEKRERLVSLMRRYAANDSLDVNWDVFEAEMRTSDRNRATVYLMRSEGMVEGNAEEILAVYLQQCSVMVTCRDLAVMAATLANGGVNPITGDQVCTRPSVRDVLTVMYTCGMYDFAGEWAFEVGIPAKSGVSGGILSPILGKLGIGVYSPGLDVHGNSIRGVRVCREMSTRLGLHVFATEEEDAMLGPALPAAEHA